MSDNLTYTTKDLRIALGDALGKAHFQDVVVRVNHHGKPHAAIVSDKAGELLDFVKGNVDESHASAYLANRTSAELGTVAGRLSLLQKLIREKTGLLSFTEQLGSRTGRGIDAT